MIHPYHSHTLWRCNNDVRHRGLGIPSTHDGEVYRRQISGAMNRYAIATGVIRLDSWQPAASRSMKAVNVSLDSPSIIMNSTP